MPHEQDVEQLATFVDRPQITAAEVDSASCCRVHNFHPDLHTIMQHVLNACPLLRADCSMLRLTRGFTNQRLSLTPDTISQGCVTR